MSRDRRIPLEVSTSIVDDGPSPIGAGRADETRNRARPAI